MGLDYADAVRCDTPEMMVRWFIEADLYDVCRNLFMACFSFETKGSSETFSQSPICYYLNEKEWRDWLCKAVVDEVGSDKVIRNIFHRIDYIQRVNPMHKWELAHNLYGWKWLSENCEGVPEFTWAAEYDKLFKRFSDEKTQRQ